MPEPTTIEELRDWHAQRQGWSQPTGGDWSKDDGSMTPKWRHPIADTIDAAVLAMPGGWVWNRTYHCYAIKPGGHGGSGATQAFDITGHSPEAIRRDLLALARLAWIAEGATP